MKVLHVIPSVSLTDGGPSKAIAAMEAALTRCGIEVMTVTTDHDGVGRRFAAASLVPFANGAARVYARKVTEFYKVAPGIVPLLWRAVPSFDVVHIHALFSFTSIAAAIVSRLRGIPYVIRPLGTLSAYGIRQRRPWLKQLSLSLVEGPILRHAAAVHFTSQQEWDEAGKLRIQFREIVIPLGVEHDETARSSSLKEMAPVLSGRRVVLYLSRLDRKKNIESLIEAFAQSDVLKSSAVLLIAGTGEPSYVAGLRARASFAGLDPCVVWLGHVGNELKAAAFAAADLFVLPSFSENFGIAAVEALLAGVPCVLGKGVAIANEVEAAGAGLAIEPTSRELVKAMTGLLSADEARKAMGRCARELAAREYSAQAMSARLIDVYARIMEKRQIGPA